jgi:hypothetical protein
LRDPQNADSRTLVEQAVNKGRRIRIQRFPKSKFMFQFYAHLKIGASVVCR